MCFLIAVFVMIVCEVARIVLILEVKVSFTTRSEDVNAGDYFLSGLVDDPVLLHSGKHAMIGAMRL